MQKLICAILSIISLARLATSNPLFTGTFQSFKNPTFLTSKKGYGKIQLSNNYCLAQLSIDETWPTHCDYGFEKASYYSGNKIAVELKKGVQKCLSYDKVNYRILLVTCNSNKATRFERNVSDPWLKFGSGPEDYVWTKSLDTRYLKNYPPYNPGTYYNFRGNQVNSDYSYFKSNSCRDNGYWAGLA